MRAKLLKNWVFFLVVLWFSLGVLAKTPQALGVMAVEELPREARHTLVLIKKGGPFPYDKDGRIFRNYEGLLPKQKRGYYHEFTVRTPGVRNRRAPYCQRR